LQPIQEENSDSGKLEKKKLDIISKFLKGKKDPNPKFPDIPLRKDGRLSSILKNK